MITAVTGFSCSGKTFVADSLPEYLFGCMISCTTRPMRPGELPGHDYLYLSDREFDQVSNFLEVDTFGGYRYGLPADEPVRISKQGLSPVHVCTPSGCRALKKFAEVTGQRFCSVFIESPLDVCFFRMLKRWLNDPSFDTDYLAARIALLATTEQQWQGGFNFVARQGSDRFALLLSDLCDFAADQRDLPPPIYRAPLDIHPSTLPTITQEIRGALMDHGRPHSDSSCRQLASDLILLLPSELTAQVVQHYE